MECVRDGGGGGGGVVNLCYKAKVDNRQQTRFAYHMNVLIRGRRQRFCIPAQLPLTLIKIPRCPWPVEQSTPKIYPWIEGVHCIRFEAVMSFYFYVVCMQKENPLMKHVRNVPWKVGDIVPDFELGKTACALYLRSVFGTWQAVMLVYWWPFSVETAFG